MQRRQFLWLFGGVMLLAVRPLDALAQGDTGKGEGEVRRVDLDAGKVTLRHGPLEGLDMPGMTMVFRTEDPALIRPLKVGDRIRFTTRRAGGAFLLESVEVLP